MSWYYWTKVVSPPALAVQVGEVANIFEVDRALKAISSTLDGTRNAEPEMALLILTELLELKSTLLLMMLI